MTTTPITSTPIEVLHPECRMLGDCMSCQEARSFKRPCSPHAAAPAEAVLVGNDLLENAAARGGQETGR